MKAEENEENYFMMSRFISIDQHKKINMILIVECVRLNFGSAPELGFQKKCVFSNTVCLREGYTNTFQSKKTHIDVFFDSNHHVFVFWE